MQQATDIIAAIATLLAAVAWPAVFLIFVLIFREPIRAAIGRVKSVKVVGLDAQLEAQAAPLVEQAVANPGTISAEQIRAASRLEVQAKAVGDEAFREQLERLCLDYERIRSLMPPSRERTRAMTGVLVSMRTLGPAVAHLLPELKASPAAGKRLAAVAIMQIQPDRADLPWLVERFRIEKPFVFYNAAIALQGVARGADAERVQHARQAAREALQIISEFKGPADQNSISVLKNVAEAGV